MATSHTADSSPTGLPRGCGWMLGKFIHHGGFSCGAANGEPVSSAGRIHHVKHSIPADDLISKFNDISNLWEPHNDDKFYMQHNSIAGSSRNPPPPLQELLTVNGYLAEPCGSMSHLVWPWATILQTSIVSRYPTSSHLTLLSGSHSTSRVHTLFEHYRINDQVKSSPS